MLGRDAGHRHHEYRRPSSKEPNPLDGSELTLIRMAEGSQRLLAMGAIDLIERVVTQVRPRSGRSRAGYIPARSRAAGG
jgi:hypothetical protein